jgi:acyl-coenzyme A synthetase/AMP-(fatty) acid ligase
MTADRPDRSAVAWRPEEVYRWREFRRRVAGLSEQLSREPDGRWLLSCTSSYAFAVGLMALWQTHRVPVLAPNAQSESLREASEGISGMITDGSLSSGNVLKLSPLMFSRKSWGWKPLNADRTRMELFTSGSTGLRKAVIKTLGQMEREIEVLEDTFGKRLGTCRVYATVSHQHIYGLLFRLLWPLCTGRPFADETFLFWEELAPRLSKRTAACLIASPTHLERITPTGMKALNAARMRLIFSSGGPLSAAASDAIRKKCGQSPVEVFGSTESGGVGWRQRDSSTESAEWTPIKGVSVSVNGLKDVGRLRVASPFVSAPDGGVLMGDLGSLTKEGRFQLAGRVDRIVKIAEKRVSLGDMERRLERHPWVASARVILLDPEGASLRSALGAAVSLNFEGRAHSEQENRVRLRAHLQKSFEASSLPRAFRFAEHFPVDSQGKSSHRALQSLFQSPPASIVTAPQRLGRTIKKSELHLRLRVPEQLHYLEGHFPKHPVVPGIVQIKWVLDAAAEWLGRRPQIRRMEAIKFKRLLLPGHEFSMVVEKHISGGENVLRFTLREGEAFYSSGRLVTA